MLCGCVSSRELASGRLCECVARPRPDLIPTPSRPIRTPSLQGSFHMEGATPMGMEDLIKNMDRLDWVANFTTCSSNSCM